MLFELVVGRRFVVLEIGRAHQTVRRQGQPLQIVLVVVATAPSTRMIVLIAHLHRIIRALLLKQLHSGPTPSRRPLRVKILIIISPVVTLLTLAHLFKIAQIFLALACRIISPLLLLSLGCLFGHESLAALASLDFIQFVGAWRQVNKPTQALHSVKMVGRRSVLIWGQMLLMLLVCRLAVASSAN